MPHRIGRLSLIVAAFCVSSRFLAAQTPSLKGVWEIVEIINTQGQHETAVQPSLYIFTDRHYSIQWVTAPRVVPEPRTRALTEQEQLAAWRPLIAHTERYEFRDNVLSMQPIVAKNPAAMASAGGGGRADVKFEGTTIAYITAKDPIGATIKLRRLE
jgi:hypothetical protein